MKFLFQNTNYTVPENATDDDYLNHDEVILLASKYYLKIKSKGLCSSIVGTDSKLFYSHLDSDRKKAAVKYCSRCDVAQECLIYALVSREEHGVWGGALESSRTILLRKAARDSDVSYTSIFTKSFWSNLLDSVNQFFQAPKITYTTKGKLLKKARPNPMYRP